MEIQVTIKSVYGNETIYPACDKAAVFTKLVRQRTLTRADIELIKQLGYAVRIVTELPATL